jgi:hypothetical protein
MRVQSIVCAGFAALAVLPTLAKDGAAILYKNCTSCHRPGENAPILLLSGGDMRRERSKTNAA